MTRRRRTVLLTAAVTSAAIAIAIAVGSASTLPVTAANLQVTSVATTVPVKTCTLTATEDAYVDETLLGLIGGGTTLQVRSGLTLALLGANKRSFLKFDLTSCAIPAVADVRSASLRLKLLSAPSASRTHNVTRVTGSWSEGTVTWNLQPTVAGSPTATITTGTTDGASVQADVRADVASFVAGTATNHGWRLRDASEGSVTAREATYASREHATAADRPQLVVTWYD